MAGRDAGRSRGNQLLQTDLPRNQALSQAKKDIFAYGVVLRGFLGLSVGLLCNQQEKTMQTSNLVHPTRRSEQRSYRTKHVSGCLPFVADLKGGTSYAPWQVWSGSTTKDARFVPMPKKAAIRIYHKAIAWNRRGKLPGCHGGLIGSHVLLVLHALIFDFLNHKTGRLDPSYSALQRATRLCRQTIATALARLKELGIINWMRRCIEDHDETGRFVLRQETNAYAILPCSQWSGYVESPEPELPHPTTWGACPPLPSILEQAITTVRDGGSLVAAMSRLEDDPRDALAAVLARLGRTLNA